MATWIWILIVIVVVVVLGLAATVVARQRRTASLRQRFGPEYDRTVQAAQDRRAAEAELANRQAQRAQLDIKPLPADARIRFADEWRSVQELFVDQPASAVTAADGLVYRVMEARGYPMGNFAAQADLISVDHPDLVENYRAAHGIHERAQTQQISTEDLREALLRYRSLFDELLAPDGATGSTSASTPAGTGAQAAPATQAPGTTAPGTPAQETTATPAPGTQAAGGSGRVEPGATEADNTDLAAQDQPAGRRGVS